MKAWVSDRLVDHDDAVVSVFDRGFRAGEGVFETVRAYGTHPFRAAAHLARAREGARVLGFELPDDGLLGRALRATAEANHAGDDLALRLTVTPGAIEPTSAFPGTPAGPPTVVVTSQPIRQDPDLHRRGATVAVVPWAREIPQVKAVSYLPAALAQREAQAQGADEALLTDARGRVLEGSYSNVFAVVRGVLVTPPVEAGILPGVTRAVTIEVATEQGIAVEERPLTVSELAAADEVFLTATTRELVPVVRVSGQLVGQGVPGPVTSALHEGYRAAVRREVRGA